MLVFGFGWSGAIMALRGSAGSPSDFLLLVILTILLALAMLSIGYLISACSPGTAAALGIAVSLWLVLIVLGDLGLMGSSIVMDLNPNTLLGAALANPLDAYKLLSVDLLDSSLDVLGPAGTYATDRLGTRLAPALLGLQLAWAILPLPIGYWLFRKVSLR
jgi:Cu-processing system permease protein